MGVTERVMHVVKVPRTDKLPDFKPKFPDFDIGNLRLHLLESKPKVKEKYLKQLIPKREIVTKYEQPTELESLQIDAAEHDDKEQPTEHVSSKHENQDHVDKHEHQHDNDELKEFEEDRDDRSQISRAPSNRDIQSVKGDDHEEEAHHEEPEQTETEKKQEYLLRFKMLKKKYPQVVVDEFNEHSDIDMMVGAYNRTIKELNVDMAVQHYQSILFVGFYAVEWGVSKVIGIDLSGFAAQQIASINKYNHLLIELGERSYSNFGSSLPVEVRLFGMILFQAGLFYISKQTGGQGALDMFSSLMGNAPKPVEQEQQAESADKLPKKRMRGPRITPQDIQNAKED